MEKENEEADSRHKDTSTQQTNNSINQTKTQKKNKQINTRINTYTTDTLWHGTNDCDERPTGQDEDTSQQPCRIAFIDQPMMKVTDLRVFWAGRASRYGWLISPPFPCLGIASLAQVSKTGLCPCSKLLLSSSLIQRSPCPGPPGVRTHT